MSVPTGAEQPGPAEPPSGPVGEGNASGGTDDKGALSVYLAEYNAFQSEVMQRIQTQNQAFNFLLIILGAASAAVVSILSANPHPDMAFVFLAVALLLPLVTCPLGYVFFDNEIMIHAIGSAFFYDRRPQIMRLADDRGVFANILTFPHLPRFTHVVFPLVSKGRWILFCLPAFPSVAIAFYYAHLRLPYLQSHTFSLVLTVSLLIADLLACAALALAVVWVFINSDFQKKLAAETSKAEAARPAQ